MSRILVLGAGGFIGGEVALGLVKRGYTVYGLTRNQEKANELIKNEIIPIISNVKDVENWYEIASTVDIVIDAISDYEDRTTPFKVQSTLEKLHAEEPNTRFIYTSGCLVYGDNLELVNESSKYTDHPISSWRLSLENSYIKIGGIIIQPGFVYGKSNSYLGYLYESTTKQQLNGATNDEPATIKLYGHKDLHMSFIHIFDLVKFYTLVVDNSITLKGQVLIANSYNEKVEDVVVSIAIVAKIQIKSIEYVKPSADNLFAQALAFNQKLSFAKSSLLFGYYPSQPKLTDDPQRYYNAWILLNDKNSSISKFNKSIVPQ